MTISKSPSEVSTIRVAPVGIGEGASVGSGNTMATGTPFEMTISGDNEEECAGVVMFCALLLFSR